VDEALRQLDLATAAARQLATSALAALRLPQVALREAMVDYVGSIASRRIDASRHASVDVMARLGDDDIVELRLWTTEQTRLAQDRARQEIEGCDLWIPDVPGLSPGDVTTYGNALVPKPRDTPRGIPQELVDLADRCLAPLRRGLADVGLAVVPVEAELQVEVGLVRAWRAYREAAVDCVAKWVDVDEHYHAGAGRFQEMRWELAGQVDVEAFAARREAADAAAAESAVVHQAEVAADAAADALAGVEAEALPSIAG
jgi:hypothetical protein